jgi:Flp pilus assembly protein TadD
MERALTSQIMTGNAQTAPIVNALQAGNHPLAERLCRERLASRPDDVDTLLLLALALQWQGRPDEATEVFRTMTRVQPEDSLAWGNYATALAATGDAAGARAAAETAARLAPQDAERLDQLASMYALEHRLAEARDTALRALGQSPDNAAIRIHAARACVACRDSRATGIVAQWRNLLPLDIELQCELADVLAQVGEVPDALAVLDETLARQPDLPVARLLRAWCCERVNKMDAAETELRYLEASGLAADSQTRREVDRQWAQIALRRNDDGTARTLLLRTGEIGPFDFEHHFLLAKACDRLGDTQAAVEALATAHERQAADIRAFSPHLFAADAELPPRSRERLAASSHAAWPGLDAPGTGHSPVFIVGFPRSGTTLVEQMLDAHPQLQSMDEQPFIADLTDELEDAGLSIPDELGRLTQADCDELRKRYFLLTHAKVGREEGIRIVDKNPLNLVRLPLIRRIFPNAKFILVLRHPCDVLVSCYLQNFQSPPLAAACRTLADLAAAYVRAMENWLYHSALMEPDTFACRYEHLVDGAESYAAQMAAFLGVDGSEQMLGYRKRALDKGYIATPSYTQVIQPITGNKVGHWRKYERYLRPLWPTLEATAGKLGYAWPEVQAVSGESDPSPPAPPAAASACRRGSSRSP